MPTQRQRSQEGEQHPQPRHRSMTGEVASMVAGNRQTQERMTARVTQVQKEVEQSVGPFGDALLRFRDAIVLAQNGKPELSVSSTPQMRTRAVTRVVTGEGEHSAQTYRTRETTTETPEIIMYFVGDNTGSMSSTMGQTGFLNLDDSSTHAKVEERIIGLTSEAAKNLSQSPRTPFRMQTILFGFPEQISVPDPDNSYKSKRITVTDAQTGAYKTAQGVVAKAVTPLGEYTDIDKQGVLTMQGSDDFRSGPTLLAPALDLVVDQVKANGLQSQDFVNGKKVGIVFVASDFIIDDKVEARRQVERLREMGMRVVGLGIGETYDGSSVMKDMQYVINSDGKNHSQFCQSPEEIITFVNQQSALEDGVSGIDTTAPVVTARAARRTRAQTQEIGGSRFTGER